MTIASSPILFVQNRYLFIYLFFNKGMIEKYRKYLTFSLSNRFEAKPLEISSGKYFFQSDFYPRRNVH